MNISESAIGEHLINNCQCIMPYYESMLLKLLETASLQPSVYKQGLLGLHNVVAFVALLIFFVFSIFNHGANLLISLREREY